MLSSCIVAGFILAGLTVAHPGRSFAVSAPLSVTTTPHPAHTSSVATTGTTTSLGGQISSPAQLSKRQEGDWDDVAATAIGAGKDLALGIMSILFGGPNTEHVTTTAPGTSATITVTSEPEKTTGPVTVTATAPGETVTTTLETVPIPTKTKTEVVNTPQQTGCYYSKPDGGIGVGPCHDPFGDD